MLRGPKQRTVHGENQMAEHELRVGIIGVGFGTVVHVPGFVSEGWGVPAIWGRGGKGLVV